VALSITSFWRTPTTRLVRAFLAERERWPLWLPVVLGAGVALYFALPVEPPWYVGPGAVAALICAAWLLRRQGYVLLVLLALLAVGAGFWAAQDRGARVAGPVLSGRLGPVYLTGMIVNVETRPHGLRLSLRDTRIARRPDWQAPHLVRLTLRHSPDLPLVVGDRVRLRAVMMPPAGPAAPGAYDFARAAWFKEIGAVGFAMSRVRVIAPGERTGASLRIAEWRRKLALHLRAQLPGQVGAVAAALMTGDRGAIPERTLQDMRDAGLAHLLAISGLHVGLIAGWLFFGVRLFLALIPGLALRAPIKKWAAAIALTGAFAYMLLTGSTVPTQRAFMMLALVMLAVMLDRVAISFRLLAWAAVAVLLWAPESLLSVSFQMSFAAVVGLTAIYEGLGPVMMRWRADGGRAKRLSLYLAAVLLTTLIASLATAPFALYHFNRVAMYGLAANLIAVPLTALWVMPWALVAFLLLPFGLEQIALLPMGYAIQAILAVAQKVASWPGAVTLVPAFSITALSVMSLGGLWFCLWRGRWRYGGILAILFGIILAASGDPPDILIDGRGRAMAARLDNGAVLVAAPYRRNNITLSTWLRRWGREEPSKDERVMRCDRLGCSLVQGGRSVGFVRDPRALEDDCRIADLVLSAVPVRFNCPSAKLVIDRMDLWRRGAIAVRWRNGGITVEGANDSRGDRPWSRPKGVKVSNTTSNTAAKGRSTGPGS
jgi:competence protein ComEC